MKKLEECLLLLKEGTAGRVQSTFSKLYKSKNEEDRQKARDLFIDACNKALSPWGSTDGVQKILNAGKGTVKNAIEELGLKNVWDKKYFPELERRSYERQKEKIKKYAGSGIHNLEKFNEDRKNGDPVALAKSTNDFGKAFKINADAYKEQTGESLESALKKRFPSTKLDELENKQKQRILKKFLGQEIKNGNFKEVYHVDYTKKKKYGEENPSFGKPQTEESRQKISQSVQNLIKANLWHSGFNGRKNLSFAEKFFLNFFKNNLDSMQQPINNRYEIGYWMDFAWEDGKVYIEVDGEQHYTEEGEARDRKRTEKLAAEGWTLLERIRWSDYKKKKTEKEKEDYLESILNKVKNRSKKFSVIVNDENKVKNGEVIKTIEQIDAKN